MSRHFNWVLFFLLVATFTACSPTPPIPPTSAPTIAVKETVIVKETVTVPVTPTPSPLPIKTSGPLIIGSSPMTAKHLNPIWLASNPQFIVFPLILPALTWFDDKAQPALDLATKVDVNGDATAFTFTLPKNAVWSDGTPLTAKDVAFTYKLALDPAMGQTVWTANLASIKGVTEFQKGTAKEIEGIKVVDDQTIRFDLKEPNAIFLFNTYLGILPAHILGSISPADFEKQPYVDAPSVTSGPYELVKYEPGKSILLKRKANYWGKRVKIDEIQVQFFEQNADMLTQLEAGGLDLAPLTNEDVSRIRKLPFVNVLSTRGIGYTVVHIDARSKDQIATLNKSKEQGGKGYSIVKTIKPYLQDRRFRQALNYALDKKVIIQTIAGGAAIQINSPIFGPDWLGDASLNPYDLNLDKAKALMKEAGVTFDAQGTALWENKPIVLTYLASTGDDARKLGELLQQQWLKAGIRVDIKLVPSAAFLQAAIDGEGDLIRNVGGRFGADPSVSSLYYSCKAGWAELVMGYCSPRLDDLQSRGLAASKMEDRQKIYRDASVILNDDLPSLFLFAPNSSIAVNKGLVGVKPNADPTYLTWNIQDWSFQN